MTVQSVNPRVLSSNGHGAQFDTDQKTVRSPARDAFLARVTALDIMGITLGGGNWASAYRESVGKRREALRLLCQSGVVTARELADDLTVVSEEHIEECISIGFLMLEKWPPSCGLLPKEEAKAFFEEHLAQLYMTTPKPPATPETNSTMSLMPANIRRSAAVKGDQGTRIVRRRQNVLATVADIDSGNSGSEEDVFILPSRFRKRRKGTKQVRAQGRGIHDRRARMADTFFSGRRASSRITSLAILKDDYGTPKECSRLKDVLAQLKDCSM